MAETGTLVTVTNEGNGRLTAGAPPVHVAVMGMERVVANWAEADLLLALLARAGAGVGFATYVNCVTGPRRAGELDGPEELHLVILDNGRSNILGSPSQEALNCIRCGACLNACPVYRQIGGHAYGDVYSGPIGAVIVPLLQDTPGGPRALARLVAVRRLLEGLPGRRSRCTSCCSRAARATPAAEAHALARLGPRLVEPARLRALRRPRRPAPTAGARPPALPQLGQGPRAPAPQRSDVPRPLGRGEVLDEPDSLRNLKGPGPFRKRLWSGRGSWGGCGSGWMRAAAACHGASAWAAAGDGSAGHVPA